VTTADTLVTAGTPSTAETMTSAGTQGTPTPAKTAESIPTAEPAGILWAATPPGTLATAGMLAAAGTTGCRQVQENSSVTSKFPNQEISKMVSFYKNN
jgi:hypothetical protein